MTSLNTMTRCSTTSRDRVGRVPGTSEIAEAEENFCKSVSNLVSTVVTEGAKVPGECGAALISSVLHLVPNFPLSPVPTPTIDLPTGMECRIILGDAPWSIPVGQHVAGFPPQFTFNWGSRAPPQWLGAPLSGSARL